MDWGLVTNIPFLIALLGILIATITDIRTHEVPDWLSYTLIALGIIFASAHSIIYSSWMLLYSILGLALGYGIGALLYYTGQWGGGDAKLLMGLGALITVPVAWAKTTTVQDLLTLNVSLPLFIEFIVWLAICGAAYGLLWMLYLIVRHWKRFVKLFPQQMKKHNTLLWVVRTAAATFTLLGILMVAGVLGQPVAGALMILLAGILYGSFYLIIAVRVAESEFMLKPIKAKQLTEGDWVVGGVKIGKEWIIPENNIGATKEQIAILKKKAPEKAVTIKEGIPFVPSFLAAIIVAIL